MKVESILTEARSQIGVKESPPNSNKTPYGEWYGMNGQPWCCIFIEWLFRTEPTLIKKTASCSDLANWFKGQKAFYKNQCQPGDLCFMNFGNKNAFASHIGIVESVSGNTVTTIEGNTGNSSQDNGGAVMRKVRTSNIVGFGRPKYSGNKSTTTSRPTLRLGSSGEDVKYLHTRLKGMHYNCDPNDAIFDNNTYNCVRHLQAVNMLEPDGVVGKLTWKVVG